MSGPYQLAFMPHLAISEGDSLRLGRVSVHNWKDVVSSLSYDRLQERVRMILSMYRQRGRHIGRTMPLENIAVINVGRDATHELSNAEFREVMELRHVLFLCCLAKDVRNNGNNAGLFSYTSENFDVVRQNFVLENDHISEVAGSVVQITSIGHRLGETQYLLPAHVGRPSRLHYDADLYRELVALRRHKRRLFRRVMRATSIFIDSYYNTHAVSVEARILLAAAAFEILLDLPERQQRKAFKHRVEDLLCSRSERRYRYAFEVPGGRKHEIRSAKGIWADRFYTLRNHIIHGAIVPFREYDFRGLQHHYIIARMVFPLLVKRLIDEWRSQRGMNRAFFERLKWTSSSQRAEGRHPGFQVVTDFGAMIEETLPRFIEVTGQSHGL